VGAVALAALVTTSALAGDPLKSGPAAGTNIPGAFHPLNVTGASAGKKNCLVWQYGGSPVAMVFARENSDGLTSLVKGLNKATDNKKLNSFVVFLSDDEGLQEKLEGFAKSNSISKCILAIDNVTGPKAYKVAKEADVTVVFYNNRKVEYNAAFKKGELNSSAVEKVLSNLSKIMN
jgi:hypothetical protein